MVFHSGILEYSNIPLVEFQWNIGIFQESGSSCAGAPTTVPVPTPPIFDARRVCVLLFSSFLELEISEAQRAHAHSAPARTAAPGTPLSRMPLSRRVCVCYIFLELKISDFRTGDWSIKVKYDFGRCVLHFFLELEISDFRAWRLIS